jgi:hypothetical protein
MKLKGVVLALTLTSLVWGQEPIKRVVLTPNSTMPSDKVAHALEHDCVGLVLTLDGNKADYLLEATDFSEGHAMSFSLFSPTGDLLAHGKTIRGMKNICKAIGRGR